MSEARSRILGDVRRALRREEPLSDAARKKLLPAGRDPRPPELSLEERVSQFSDQLKAASGRVSRVASIEDVSNLAETYLLEVGQALDVVVAPDPRLDAIRWSNRFRVERRQARGEDGTGVNLAFAAIAETGSVVIASGSVSPGNLSFLPEDHLCVLYASDIVCALEDVWAKLRERDAAVMPRAVNIISAPSKTADVEFTLQEGAHGPRRLHAIIVG